MDRLLRLGGGMPGLGQSAPPSDAPVVDTAEQVYISSLALLKVGENPTTGCLVCLVCAVSDSNGNRVH
ncbi:hypothetical protein BaRGS_00034867 [Batillaria attramentaria]|uniref:Uncharacterized protein n=1 Tax=Batillaria attramentaria TaxID=370345 RepID=A0ABD0JGB9_9CAEN